MDGRNETEELFDPFVAVDESKARLQNIFAGDFVNAFVANGGQFASGILAAGKTYTHPFARSGTYHYHDGLHPTLRRTVIVKGADGTTRWPQFSPALVAALHARGLKACAYHFLYGRKPSVEAAVSA